ncbi:hypothetical protein PSAC2689_30409 [Paraburkholderia sacchari]
MYRHRACVRFTQPPRRGRYMWHPDAFGPDGLFSQESLLIAADRYEGGGKQVCRAAGHPFARREKPRASSPSRLNFTSLGGDRMPGADLASSVPSVQEVRVTRT